MQKSIGNSLARAVVLAAVLWGLGAPAQAQISPEVDKKLEPIFAEAKGSFFGMVGRILQNHPMKAQLGDAELARVLNGQKEIPYLFERLMVFAYQKDEPQFTQWAGARRRRVPREVPQGLCRAGRGIRRPVRRLALPQDPPVRFRDLPPS